MAIIMIISSLVICILGIALNSSEIVSLVYVKRTKLPFDITLISLAASDLMLAATSILIIIFPVFVPASVTWAWYFMFSMICILTSSTSSALHLLFIAIQRLIAVLYPLKLTVWMTRNRCIIVICLLWLIPIVISAPVSIHFYALQEYFMCSPLISASIILVCYIVINIKMLTRKRLAVSGQPSQNIHVLVYSICISAIFLICNLPYTLYTILYPDSVQNKTTPLYAIYLFYLQVILDPVVYFFSHISKKNRCVLCFRSFHCCGSKAVSGQQDK